MSEDCKDFISKLLDKNANSRLGTKSGLKEILDHPWLKDYFDQENVMEKTIEAPMKPKLSADPLDVSQFDTVFTSEEAMVSIVP
jgi:serum/glucocorticoid-regulated kinase 2